MLFRDILELQVDTNSFLKAQKKIKDQEWFQRASKTLENRFIPL